MVCPHCLKTGSKVVDKRDNNETNSTRRRRECLNCEGRFTTYEKIDNACFLVKKKSGKLEEFDRTKLKNSILKGLKKRPIPEIEVDKLLEQIDIKLASKKKSIISTREIGEQVLEGLQKLDKVAYMLYATVYLDFENVEDISAELNKLIKFT